MQVKKAREVKKSHVSLTGLFYSQKNLRQISFESSLEADYAELLEFDSDVESFLEQPTKLLLSSSKYFPDFLVKYSKKAKIENGFVDKYVEIKYTYELEKKKDYYENRFQEVREVVSSLNMNFEIVTEKTIRNNYLNNVKILNGYKYQPVDEVLKGMVVDQIERLGYTTAEEVVRGIGGGLYERAHSIFIIWHLLANDFLYADLNEPISIVTEISINKP
ncbi:TnsA endonuclease C terminal [Marivirga sericea]|uniref:TnsA endonuclease C terminal n=1 Tax=Marivirga sericea TaxID=1028 RepID=A0A1X7KPB2_9BACT|nr:TnsA endonuclease N-terminal domain-containing protein [Marivirga sericea]SMG42600.1 TnsA endonuclease C terminal [Marivirga sericea]